MEAATTSSSLYGDRDGERGAGGKLKKPSGRKPPATPYSRPAAATANSRNSGSTGGWWSKFVDPAKRMISGGATMLLPSYFPQSASAAALPTSESQDKLDVEVLPNADKDERQSLSHFVPKLTELAGPSKIMADKSETNCISERHGERSNNSKGYSEISRIEQLIEGKNFSRDEVNRLMEILTSKVEGEERKTLTTISGQAEEVLRTPLSMIPDERNQRDVLRTPGPLLQPNVRNAVGASPVDIAKAYMGGRSLEGVPSPRTAVPKGETTAHQTDEVFFNPLAASTSIESTTCWPGAVVQDQCNYTTPRQGTRYGLHDFPRTTPYSRTIRSKPRDKLQTDSRLLRTSPNPYQQSRTPIFGQERLRKPIQDDNYGSVGPIRRIGSKLASETRPRGSNYLNSKVFQQINVSDGIIPPPEKVPEKSAGTSFTEPAAHVNPYPSQAVKRILEQLDRKKPTPKEMADELKLAASWRNSPGVTFNPKSKDSFSFPQAGERQTPLKTDISGPMFTATATQNSKQTAENTNSQIQSHGKSIASTSEVLTSAKSHGIVIRDSETGYAVDPPGISFDRNNKSSAHVSSSPKVQATSADTSLAKASSDLPSFSQSNGQHVASTGIPSQSKFEQTNKAPQHPSGSKPNLAHISVSRHDFISRASENGAGFTFPVSTSSSALSEPPTPSVMPFTSNNSLPPPSHAKEEPSYSFGTKSSSRLVFSFPSTSISSQDDALDIKFDFGTDKKTRLSFGSTGKDAICY